MKTSLIYRGLKHYFLIDFNQKPGQLKEFVNDILLEGIDITRFEYLKKTNKDTGSVLIGVELNEKKQLEEIIKNMDIHDYNYIKINENDLLYSYLI